MATTFLILSDTHDDAFPDPASIPKVDVVLHCGDLTKIGGLSNYKKAIANLKAIDAELTLVIAGMSVAYLLGLVLHLPCTDFGSPGT